MIEKDEGERKVFIVHKPSSCGRCKAELDKGSWIELAGDQGALCMECSGLDALDFLPAGNTALTRRTKKYSAVWAVVLKWSRARQRYERQGLIVEPDALEQAYSECALDEDDRAKRRVKAARKRQAADQDYVAQFARTVREMYPHCPPDREFEIAAHACEKHSGRIGRTALAKDLDPHAVRLAVMAHIRHHETDYEDLLMRGLERFEALEQVRHRVRDIIAVWEN